VTYHKGGSKAPHILNVAIRWGEWSPQRATDLPAGRQPTDSFLGGPTASLDMTAA